MKQSLANYYRSFSFVGLVVATLFFSASLSPSLIPRNYWVQGFLSGFALAIGYGVGLLIALLYEFLELKPLSGKPLIWAQRITVAAVAIFSITFIWRMTYWQNSIRSLMEMPPLETSYPYRMMLIAVTVAVVLIAFARLIGLCVRWTSNQLSRFVPRRIAVALGIALVTLAFLFLSNDVIVKSILSSADSFFLNVDELVDDQIEQPDGSNQTGSPDSLVDWETIGRQGKNFLVTGPSRETIESVTGQQAEQPIRVYVGMRTRPTPRDRAKLALKELKRVGGFDRSVLIVSTPTGTGWLDPSAVDTVEFLHHGDTAIVSTQYSYLPSWITILVDPSRSKLSARALFDEVYSYWKTLPKDTRPKLYLQGLSLGSFGSEVSADLFSIFEDPINGSVWSGPPFPSQHWKQVVRDRNEGSPEWLPTFRNERMLRFTSQTNTLDTGKPWGPIRSVYIQHASDPMVWFSPDLAWNRPDWLTGEYGPDVSPSLRWYPIITFLQVAFDLPLATTVPLGYGHNYAPSSYIDAWVAVTAPEGWDEQSLDQLKEYFRTRETPKP